MPATEEARKIFFERGILAVPDIVANSGGVIAAYCELSNAEKTDAEIVKIAFDLTQKTISKNTEIVLKRALAENKNPREIAVEVAMEKLKQLSQ